MPAKYPVMKITREYILFMHVMCTLVIQGGGSTRIVVLSQHKGLGSKKKKKLKRGNCKWSGKWINEDMDL